VTPERRAVAFVLVLIALSVAARWLDRPQVEFPASAALDLAAHEDAVRRAVAGAARRPLGEGERIDVNAAPAAELERLPRVGPALARRIIAAREAAPFRSLADLRAVPGIGPALLESIAPHVLLPAPVPAPVPATPSVPARPMPMPLPMPDPAPRAPTRPRTPAFPPAQPEQHGQHGQPAPPRQPAPLPINHATPADLQRLPGIGPSLAASIIAHRDTAGPFLAPADLEKVRGIGPALRARLEALVRFTP
jgi:competence protein ComEA